MELIEVCRLVVQMRNAQKDFFRTKNRADLDRSKRLEKAVDRALVEVFSQPTLFDEME